MEKTCIALAAERPRRKHLHGRGEDQIVLELVQIGLETPPRTWRRLRFSRLLLKPFRNTSTDVEKTSLTIVLKIVNQKHLHGHGEDYDDKDLSKLLQRNTSTDVEKTSFSYSVKIPVEKHLHGRGEDVYTLLR